MATAMRSARATLAADGGNAMNRDYGAVYVPFLGFRPIRSRLMLAVIVVITIIVDSGALNTPIDKLLCYVAQATLLPVSPPPPAKPVTKDVQIRWDKDDQEVSLEFPDYTFEVKYGYRLDDGALPFAVHRSDKRQLAEK